MTANEKAFKRVASTHYEQRLRAAYLKSGENDFISGREIDDIVDYGFLAGKKQATIALALKTALPEHRHGEIDKAIHLSPQNSNTATMNRSYRLR